MGESKRAKQAADPSMVLGSRFGKPRGQELLGSWGPLMQNEQTFLKINFKGGGESYSGPN